MPCAPRPRLGLHEATMALLLLTLAAAAEFPRPECTQTITAAYDTVLNRPPDPEGLESHVSNCATVGWKYGSDVGSGLAGQPFSWGGLAYTFRTSPEYASGVKAPAAEKGGCRLCHSQQPSPCCSQTTAPPEDCPFTEPEDGIFEAGASACPMPRGAWGSTFMLLAAIAGAVYVGGGVGFSKHTTGSVAHPHAEKWREGAGLVVDGARFAAAALGSGGVPSSLGTAEYSTLGDAEGHPPGGAPAAETAAGPDEGQALEQEDGSDGAGDDDEVVE